MNTPALKASLYRNVNIALGLIILGILLLAAVLPGWRSGLGISVRLLVAGFCFINGAWIIRVRKSAIIGGLLLVVGIGLIVTVLLGYGFNGQPPLS